MKGNACDKSKRGIAMHRFYTIKDIIGDGNPFYCYGTGDAALTFARYCQRRKIKIKGFLVTKKNQKNENFFNKSVYQIDEIQKPLNAGIIIAIARLDYVEEVFSLLKDVDANVLWVYDDTSYIRDLRRDLHKEIRKREKLSIFDFERLSLSLDYEDIVASGYMLYYGIYKCVKKYTKGYQKNIRHCAISHGFTNSVVLGGYNEYFAKHYGTLYTCGGDGWWQKCLPASIRVHVLGPYISYVKSLYSYEKLERMKKKLGRTLLVFPLHSVDDKEYTEYDIDEFIREVDAIKDQYCYDTVMVCMYWRDIHTNTFIPYKKKGWKIVTAGHRLDSNFLRRLRSIILLSDMVVTNGVGTHVGYAVCLNKPVYIMDLPSYSTTIDVIRDGDGNECADQFIRDCNISDKEIKEAFSTYCETITDDQLYVIRKYWGYWNVHHIRR